MAKSESTVLKIQWRSRTSWSHNRMEMVSICHFIKFLINMADINKWVVASIELGCTVICLFIPKLQRFRLQANTIPCDQRVVWTPHYLCVHLHIPHTWTFLAWLKISMVSRQKSSSHLARHVSCTVLAVSVFDVTCTSHSLNPHLYFLWETLNPLLRDTSDSLAEWLRQALLHIKLRFSLLLKFRQRRRLFQNLQRNENSWSILDHHCSCSAKVIGAQKNWRPCGDPGNQQWKVTAKE